MSRWSIPQPWPEGTVATTDEFIAWFYELGREEQDTLLQDLLESSRRAHQCYALDHTSQIAEQREQLQAQRVQYGALLERHMLTSLELGTTIERAQDAENRSGALIALINQHVGTVVESDVAP